jgi:hypothetical protein
MHTPHDLSYMQLTTRRHIPLVKPVLVVFRMAMVIKTAGYRLQGGFDQGKEEIVGVDRK